MTRYILLFSIFLFLNCKSKNEISGNLYDYIPSDTVLVIKVNNYNTINNVIKNNPLISSLKFLDQNLFNTINEITPTESSTPSLFCFTPYGKNKMAITIINKLKPKDSVKKLDKKYFKYNGEKITEIESKENSYFKTQIKETQFISSSKLILENCIRLFQNDTKGIQSKEFYNLTEYLDIDSPINILLRYDAHQFIKNIFYKTPLFPLIGESWSSYDLNLRVDPLAFDGIHFINDSIPNNLTLIKDLDPKETFSENIIPQNFKSLLIIPVDNFQILENNFIKYSRYKNIAIKKIDFQPFNHVNEISWINYMGENAVFLHLKSDNNLNEILYNEKNIIKEFREINIIKKTLPNDFIIFSSNFVKSPNLNWCSKINDFVVYAESEKLLKKIISNYKENKNLKQNINFNALKSTLASKSSFLWIGNSESIKKTWEENSTTKAINRFPVKKFPIIALQGVNDNNILQMRFTAQKNIENKKTKNVSNQFSLSIDNSFSLPPKFLYNHKTKKMDIAVQDDKNILYLFSNTGNLFWKKKLSNQIIGQINQVDIYNNNKNQMAFNTLDEFIVIDRNGEKVNPLNINFSKLNRINPLSIFDYDQNKKYRFLISSENKISMYDKRAIKVKGFELKNTSSKILFPPKHLRIKNKDYITIQLENGVLKILNRKGKDRIKVKEKIDFSNNEIYLYRNSFTTSDKKGNLIQVDLKGNVFKSPLKLSDDHKINMTSKTLVTFSENILSIKGVPITLPFGNYTSPQIFYINDTIYISLTNIDNNKVYLFFSNGKLVNGFPIYGNSKIDLSNIDNDKHLELIVKSEKDNLILYEIN